MEKRFRISSQIELLKDKTYNPTCDTFLIEEYVERSWFRPSKWVYWHTSEEDSSKLKKFKFYHEAEKFILEVLMKDSRQINRIGEQYIGNYPDYYNYM